MGDEDESQWTPEQSRRNQTPQDSWEVCCNWSWCCTVGIDVKTFRIFTVDNTTNIRPKKTLQYLIAKDESVELCARSEVAH